MRRACFLLLAGCGGAVPPAIHAQLAPPAVMVTAQPAPPIELDFEARLNGARAFGSLVIEGGVARGTLFYASVGRDITIEGTANGGALVLHEMRGATAISTITLAGHDEMTGTFERGKVHGAASLRTIARAKGAPTFVAARPFQSRLGECVAHGTRPWVLGLADKSFQRELNDALAVDCEAKDLDERTVSFETTLDEGGLLAFELTVDTGFSNWHSGFLAAIDARAVLNDAIDMRMAGKLLTPALLREHGADPNQWCMWRGCAGMGQWTGPADVTAWVIGYVVAQDGVRFCELAGGGMKQWAVCTQRASFATLAPALQPGPLADFARSKR